MFSVIIPLYNGSKHIVKTLDSIAAQTNKDYEIVICDDGSTDGSKEIVSEYIKANPLISVNYVYQENRGLGGARNTAIRSSKGEYIALLDQDDVWYPEKLERVAKAFADDPEADIVCHDYNIVYSNGIFEPHKTGPFSKDMHRKLLFGGNTLGTPAVSFKKKSADTAGGFSQDRRNLHLLEDYEMWLRMAYIGCKFVFLPDILAEFRYHEDNSSVADAGKIVLMCKSELFVIKMHFRLLKDKRMFDWYNYRRRRAECVFYAAGVLASRAKKPSKALVYYLWSFFIEPVTVTGRIFVRLRKLFFKG